MKEHLGSVNLLDRAKGAFVEADLFKGLDEKNFGDFEDLWKPELVRARASVSSWLDAAQVNAQDIHWKWREKGAEVARHLALEAFAVEYDGRTQGMMLVNLAQFARLEGQVGRELIYVELMATAPWNRYEVVSHPLYKGVGHVLLGTAMSLSIENGFGGRVGLHALPQSESWYAEHTSFTNLGRGLDPCKQLPYFEVTESQARAFLESP